ncbi:MAG: c-type cytochrome [Salibacteraceae bacterium]|nr:c-type cytochrome [Salibacteraceae bacterium]
MNNTAMKTNTFFRKSAVAFMALLITAAPQAAWANTTLVKSTGISDESLLVVLTVFAGFQLLAILIIANVIKGIAANKQIWQARWNKTAAAIATLILVGASGQLMATDAKFDSLVSLNDTAFLALITLNLFLLLAFIYLVVKLNSLFKMLIQDEEGKVPESWIDKVNVMLTDAVPIDQEEDVMTDHEYDGIRELDNNLPPWWLYGFYLSIVVAILYSGYYIVGSGPSSAQEYLAEMDEAETAKTAFMATQTYTVDENNVELLTDAASLAAGAKIFKLNCTPCHAETGGSMPGGVGPNLTDEYWINGGAVTDIFRTIKYGVPAKGMVSWEAQLSPSKIQQVASYIKSLRGSNPANAKEPQGDLYEEETAASEEAPAETPADSTTTSTTEAATGEITMVD